MESKTKKNLRRAAIGSATLVTLFLGFGGLLHTKAGRPWLAKLAKCPVQASPEAVASARKSAVASLRGTQAIATRPALGFSLDTTSRDDVKAWAERNRVSCTELRGGASIRCDEVPAAVLPEAAGQPDVIREVMFGFRESGHLQQIETLSSRMSPDAAADAYRGSVASLASVIGGPTSGTTDTDPNTLAATSYALSTCQFQYSNYVATITVMNVASSGILLRQQFLSAT